LYVPPPQRQLALTPSVQPEKGGDINVVKESQKKRNASVELVDEVMALFNEHKEGKLPPSPIEAQLTVQQTTTLRT
jgi:seryl-tRNA synthetase